MSEKIWTDEYLEVFIFVGDTIGVGCLQYSGALGPPEHCMQLENQPQYQWSRKAKNNLLFCQALQ